MLENEERLTEDFVEKIKELIPRFSKNLFFTMNKDGIFVLDEFNFRRKIDLLIKLYENGRGKNLKGDNMLGVNTLIKHYHNTQEICPLWVIVNCLTLGDLTSLFSMLDKTSQEQVINKILSVRINDTQGILSFLGLIEDIRQLRNIINHYEPLIPFLKNKIRKLKNLKTHKIIYTILWLFNMDKSAENIFKDISLPLTISRSSSS